MLDRTSSPIPMTTMTAVIVCLLLVGGLPPFFAGGMGVKETLVFAADMARDGNWREALYRWKQISNGDPDNPRLLNNLAVASEALGQVDEARTYYARAGALSRGDERIQGNRRRFLRFLQMTRPGADEQAEEQTTAQDEALPAVADGDEKPKKGKTAHVAIALPVPPRLDIAGMESVLIASFRADETTFLDVNRELTRFMRSEFRKRTPLEVRDAVPAPAIPEQSVEDLLANSDFWKRLAEEYDADLIVSGLVSYDRQDVSGFRDVDLVDPRTGQKVRETRFVEAEEFSYSLEVFFMDGASGTLLFRDRMRQGAVFPGSQNDPITAFYELTETMADDVLGVITSRMRTEDRVIFKR
jgi:hypothetical protein